MNDSQVTQVSCLNGWFDYTCYLYFPFLFAQVSLSTVLQQEAYLLFYIRDKDYKPRKVPFPPGSPALNTPSSTHFKADPNFLGAPVKPASHRSVGLDKSGTPLVKLPAAKPTGVVQPSPQKETSRPPVTKGQSLSPPTTSTVAGTPKTKSLSPNSSFSPNGGNSPMVREFSIPLRKISSTTPTKQLPEKVDVARPGEQPQQQQQQVMPTSAASLRFTPRQVSAPSKSKKQHKTTPVPSITLNQETDKGLGDGKLPAAGVTQHGIQAAVSIAGQSNYAESKTPAFKAIQSEEFSQGFIGPTLPSSPLTQSPLRVTPFSLKVPTSMSPKIAMVSPQPQTRGKPVARVRPNPHPVSYTHLTLPTIYSV